VSGRALAEMDQIVFDGTRFLFRRRLKKGVCREIEVVELAMMEVSNGKNDDSIREIMVKLVCIQFQKELIENAHLQVG
jgi:hypothetical protein